MFRRKTHVSDGYIVYPGKGKIYDSDVAAFLKRHLRFRDRFNLEKVTESVLLSQYMLMGVEEIPKKKGWKF